MESDKIEILLEKYFQGATSIAEEKELKNYFSSSDVAQHLEQYQSIFGYFATAKEQKSEQPVVLFQQKKRQFTWLSIAASVVVLLGVGTFAYLNHQTKDQDSLGSYDDPEIAFRETQRALSLLSTHVNSGVESVDYIYEYEETKNLIFKKY